MMDAKKRRQISEVLGLYKHSVSDLEAYVLRMVQNARMQEAAPAADGKGDFWAEFFADQRPTRKSEEKRSTPIPEAAEGDALGHDLHLFLGYSGVSVEDLAEYVADYRTAQQPERPESMEMSDALRQMSGVPGSAVGAAEMFARSDRINQEGAGFDPAAFLRGIKSVT